VTTAKIRVGLMSSDLRNHPVSYFALSLIDHYDPDQVDLFGYSFYPLAADPVQRHIAQKLSLTVMPQASDAEIAQRIADDRLDMLVELGGSTHLNRLDVMAWRPAPVQTSWLGYPHSAGLSRIDYIVTDPYIEPEDKRLLIEQPLRLPESWVSIDRLGFGDMPIDPVLPEDRLGFLTFGTANNPYKYSGHCIALWAQIMLAVPDSKFLFIRPEGDVPAFRDNLAAAFAQHGIERNRLAYAPVRGKHLPFYNKMDIALDTLPHTGGTTTCESLWMGVPTVTKIGPAFFERLSFSNLTNAGLGDLCARSDEAYVETAIGLAADKARRQELRQGLRAQIRANPLGQPARFAAGFFNAIGQVLD
jgi:predicted O-linked N-acetylglucosamine transferase (SPINDLY family)